MFAQTPGSCLEHSAKSTIRPNAADSRSLAPRRILGGSGGSGRGRGSLRLAHTAPRKQTSRGTLRPVQRRGKLGNSQESMDYIAGNRHSNRSALSEMQCGGGPAHQQRHRKHRHLRCLRVCLLRRLHTIIGRHSLHAVLWS